LGLLQTITSIFKTIGSKIKEKLTIMIRNPKIYTAQNQKNFFLQKPLKCPDFSYDPYPARWA
jgi:hypothetical protein